MLFLRAETGNAPAAVSLMSAEVDRITVAGQWTLSIVPNLVQLGLAFWILSGQLGGVSVAPVVVAIGNFPPSLPPSNTHTRDGELPFGGRGKADTDPS
ncbi:hypothetical protein LY76DRAFT_212280 [Colletotrichum caudatum]|nr:hypothetical protein LY76DRAFT_212280 [Colletotrichum caudatum]